VDPVLLPRCTPWRVTHQVGQVEADAERRSGSRRELAVGISPPQVLVLYGVMGCLSCGPDGRGPQAGCLRPLGHVSRSVRVLEIRRGSRRRRWCRRWWQSGRGPLRKPWSTA
jgi:hypothetical protein